MTPLNKEDLDRLRELEKNATPGPWKCFCSKSPRYINSWRKILNSDATKVIAEAPNRSFIDYEHVPTFDFIVAARNSMASLLEMAEENQRLREDYTRVENHWRESILEFQEEIEKLQAYNSALREALNIAAIEAKDHPEDVMRDAREILSLTADQAYEKMKAMEEVVEAARIASNDHDLQCEDANSNLERLEENLIKLDALEKK